MDILSAIVENKQREIETARRRVSMNDLIGQCKSIISKRSLWDALKQPGSTGVNIVAEIKRKSPSKGDLKPDLDPAVFAAAYEAGGAAAISVLTDSLFFGGAIEDVKQAKQASRLPVLRKEFIISDYQLYESAAAGADAVLLIVRLLTCDQINDYLDICDALHLDALVEIHTDADLTIVKQSRAKLVGINNRNLKSFETSLDTSIHLASRLNPDQIPVAASAISGIDDIRRLKKNGIFNFLIGESIVRAENPKQFIRSLLDC